MELLKSNPIIDEEWKPSLDLDCNRFFSRAMKFAQTNYHVHLSKIANTFYSRISPTVFFEEYIWRVCCAGSSPEIVTPYFPELVTELLPYHQTLWNGNWFLSREPKRKMVDELTGNSAKFDAFAYTAKTLCYGIKLYGWNRYRNHFLDKTTHLEIFPFISKENSARLASSIGLEGFFFEEPILMNMAKHWGFVSVPDMINTLASQFVLQTRVIALILWYAAMSFPLNFPES